MFELRHDLANFRIVGIAAARRQRLELLHQLGFARVGLRARLAIPTRQLVACSHRTQALSCLRPRRGVARDLGERRVQIGGGLEPILAELRSEFDFLLIDTPPVLPVCDALVVAQNVDAVMMAVRRDVSRVEKVAAALGRFGAVGIPVLGVVAIGLDDDPVSYGGYYRSRRRYAYSPRYLVSSG